MAIDANAVARVTGIESVFKQLPRNRSQRLPQQIAVFAQGATAATFSDDPVQVTSEAQAGSLFGWGSPIHLIVEQLLPANGDGVGTVPVTVYPLDDHASGVAATGTITPTGTQTKTGTYYVVMNGMKSNAFTITAGMTVADVVTGMVAAINAKLNMPMTAAGSPTVATLTAKWKGTTGNAIKLSVEGPSYGVTFAFAQPSSGATNPTVDAFLSKITEKWETLLIDGIGDTTTMDTIKTFGEGRWLDLVARPFVSFNGSTEPVLATATAVTDARKDDYVNCRIHAPGNPALPWVVAARAVSKIAKIANNNPARGYGGQELNGLPLNDLDVAWLYTDRDVAVKKGASTSSNRGGVVHLEDVVTMFHPDGEQHPAYRFVVTIVKLQNILYNFNLEFASETWDDAPMIPDGQPTTNESAKTPSMAVAAAARIIDLLALDALVSDPDYAKESLVASIDTGNPNRMNLSTTLKVSGNTNIKAITLNWGFHFGG